MIATNVPFGVADLAELLSQPAGPRILGGPVDRFRNLFDWEELLAILDRHGMDVVQRLRIVKNGTVLPQDDFAAPPKPGAAWGPRVSPERVNRLCAEGVRFADAQAATSWTLASHVSILTGMNCLEHGVRTREFRLDEATETLAERVRDDYLARSTVDPYATAPLLASRPVLVVQAERDGIVRREFGDLLWERLGRPERWMGNYGHLLLIYFLSDHAEEIADWVEAAVPRKKG